MTLRICSLRMAQNPDAVAEIFIDVITRQHSQLAVAQARRDEAENEVDVLRREFKQLKS